MPDPRHPGRDMLERFSRGAVSAEQTRWIEDHLRAGCPVCQRKVDDLLWQLQDSAPSSRGRPEEEQPWRRLLARLKGRMEAIHRERAVAPGLVGELLAVPPGEREGLVRSKPFQTVAVCELLIERSFAEGFQDPARARELAELAVHVADRLDVLPYGRSVVQDFRARAWAHLGHARRLGSDLRGAEEAIALAEHFFEEGSADPLEEARVLDLKASLLGDQGRLEEAAELLDVVIDIYEEIRDVHRQGRALISQGLFLAYAGQPEEGLGRILRGLGLIHPEQEPRLVLLANHHVAWLEARIAARIGRHAEAERRFHELRDAFVEQRLGYDASLVTLDLAALYLEQGRTEEVRRLAAEALPVLLAQDIHPEAMAALIAFQQATEIGRATPAMVQQVAAYLQRARNNPGLGFGGWELASG